MKWFTKILALLGIGVVCTACYGTPYDLYNPYRVGAVEGKVTDNGGNPVNGIKVSVVNGGHTFTGTDGWYRINYRVDNSVSGLQLEFDDVDGDDNGGEFKSTSFVFPIEEGKHYVPDAVMTLK